MHLNTAVILGFLAASTTTTGAFTSSAPPVNGMSPQPLQSNGVAPTVSHRVNSTSALRSATNSTGREAGLRGTIDKGSSGSGAAAAAAALAASSYGEKDAPNWKSLALLGGISSGLHLILAV